MLNRIVVGLSSIALLAIALPGANAVPETRWTDWYGTLVAEKHATQPWGGGTMQVDYRIVWNASVPDENSSADENGDSEVDVDWTYSATFALEVTYPQRTFCHKSRTVGELNLARPLVFVSQGDDDDDNNRSTWFYNVLAVAREYEEGSGVLKLTHYWSGSNCPEATTTEYEDDQLSFEVEHGGTFDEFRTTSVSGEQTVEDFGAYAIGSAVVQGAVLSWNLQREVRPVPEEPIDVDGDGIEQNPTDDSSPDNCTGTPNPRQADRDDDALGDACDPSPGKRTTKIAFMRGNLRRDYPWIKLVPAPPYVGGRRPSFKATRDFYEPYVKKAGGTVVARGSGAVWSPDGESLFFLFSHVGKTAVLETNEFGTSPTVHGSWGDPEFDDPKPWRQWILSDHVSYSPDGSRHVFEKCVASCNSPGGSPRTDLFVADRDGDNEARLTESSRGCTTGNPEWSPNGKWIVYVMRPHRDAPCRGAGLNVIRPSGSAHRRLRAPGVGGCSRRACPVRGTHPTWAPDSRRVAFTNGAGLYTVNIDGSGARLVIKDRALVEHMSPSWQRR